MELFNFLISDVGIALYQKTYDVALNSIGRFISTLISGVGSVGVGIILFSLILKLVVMPFDVYQRITMRKQNQKMKENQAKMEKLQKQYANNKELYNQKVMEMYKESGMSMFSSCLPMILSMVIFFVAIGAFNTYSQYANVENYNYMVNAYTTSIQGYAADLTSADEYILDETNKTVTIKEIDKDIYLVIPYVEQEGVSVEDYAKSYKGTNKSYFIEVSKVENRPEMIERVNTAITEAEAANGETALTQTEKDNLTVNAYKSYYQEIGQNAVLDVYENGNEETKPLKDRTSFLWIKNIWDTDASYKSPVYSYTDFSNQLTDRSGCSCNPTTPDHFKQGAYHEEDYNIITKKLGGYKNQANGYYVLILLSIGTILLQQWISMRSQKEQQKYSSVDGQGAAQQKTMMVMMTGMFAIFSFMYSSAFSIYMITSNILSMVSTLVINQIVDRVQEKREAQALQERYNKRFPGRVAPGENKNKKK